jgi:hypothetical protein
MVGKDVGGRKSWGGVGDDTPFNSLVLQNFSLHALLHAIPPPWGFHLSQPPNRKFAPAVIKTEKAESNVCVTTKSRVGVLGRETENDLLHSLSTASSLRLLLGLLFKGTKVWFR